MAVGYSILPQLLPVTGIRLGTTEAGIKYTNRRDLVVIELAKGTQSAAVFTQNAFCAAPVQIAKTHLNQAVPRYLLINTGNANAGTGHNGLEDAKRCCELVAESVGCSANEVLPFSTGVIGEPLEIDRFQAGIPHALANLSEQGQGWEDAAHGIMTTDTIAKGLSEELELNGSKITITGIAKGSGMIRPDMATMLAYIATDASIDSALLQRLLNRAVKFSFNRITVDGDTSTNDSCLLMATGKSGVQINEGSEEAELFSQLLNAMFQKLAQLMIRDAEGATKFVTVEIDGGADEAECERVAYTVAHSPLVKTALFASDPNWGRILAAVGRASVSNLDLEQIKIYLGDVLIVENGGRAESYTEERGQSIMDREEITIRVDLARGSYSATVWTSDLSYKYVEINAEYRS
ncbi:MAG: bifunctional glutamate N-acetyltransferase/amino-acid acetyltransferase ArgJ [Chromatiales bacterium]|nr:bifunctional glutamate N-acetyltransferase/amino-acid acetyltransferase ArgJ [Chromatiales bacterium]